MICTSIVVCKAETIEKVGEINAGFAVFDSVEDSNGNYYLSGVNSFTSEGRVAKYNANYELIVEKTFDDYGKCSTIVLDSEGNIYVGCYSKEVFVGHGITEYIQYNIYNNRVIIKLDSNFNVVFEKNLSEEFDISEIVELKVYDGYLYAIGYYIYSNKYIISIFFLKEKYRNYQSINIINRYNKKLQHELKLI